MIQFDTLPQENPYALPAPGLYKGKITEAEIRASKSKDPNTGNLKPDYLNLKIALTDINGKGCGSIYDIVSESDSSVVKYKLARLLLACGIPLVGSMSLKDLAKIINGKEIAVDVNIDKPKEGNNPKAQVDLFSHEAYYPAADFVEVYNTINRGVAADGTINEGIPENAPENMPFDATDGGTTGLPISSY